MVDKAGTLQAGVARVTGVAGDLLGLDEGSGQVTQALRQIMDPKQVVVNDLALRCETEMIACDKAGQFLSGCLMGAAMNEALIALRCLIFEDRVKQTQHYAKAQQRETYAAMVGNWKFEHLIRVVDELSWIPNDVVAPEMLAALVEVYRELMPVSRPEMPAEKIESGAGEFKTRPGTAMLRLIQDLRNSIHAGAWIRGNRVLDITHFEGWCRVAIHVSAEIRDCLLHVISVAGMPKFDRSVAVFSEQILQLKERFKSAGKDPSEVDELIKDMFANELAQARRNSEKQ